MKKALITILFSSILYCQNLSQISTARLAGQMILIGFEGKEIKEFNIRKLGQEASLGKLGGIVFRANNFDDLEQAKKLVNRFKNIAIVNPLFLAIDYKNSEASTDFAMLNSPDFAGANLNLNDARLSYLKSALSLKELGINLNLNLNLSKENADNIDKLSIYAREYSDVFRQSNILLAARSFPGDRQSERKIVNDYELALLKPFYDISQTYKSDMILVSNKIYPLLDSKPAAMSAKIINILKSDLGFDGLVVSDDILGGDLDEIEFSQRVIDIINAGVDILYFGLSRIRYGDTASFVVSVITRAVNEGKISRARLEDAYTKITNIKEKLK